MFSWLYMLLTQVQSLVALQVTPLNTANYLVMQTRKPSFIAFVYG